MRKRDSEEWTDIDQLWDAVSELRDRVKALEGKFVPSRWLDMKAACEYAKLSRKTIRKLMKDGEIYGERTGGGTTHWRIDRESIDTYFNRGMLSVLEILDSIKNPKLRKRKSKGKPDE